MNIIVICVELSVSNSKCLYIELYVYKYRNSKFKKTINKNSFQRKTCVLSYKYNRNVVLQILLSELFILYNFENNYFTV